MVLAVLTFLTAQKISSITLECEFKQVKDHWGIHYACVAQHFRTTLNNRNVTGVKGTHILDMTNDDVKEFYMEKQACPYLPLNLGAFFENLEIFYAKRSNVQHILVGDLNGLTKLRVFDASHNPIEYLDKDFFKNYGTIEKISFYDCHLRIIDSQALDPLVKLNEAYFQLNVCINRETDKAHSIRSLKAAIRRQCQSSRNQDEILNQSNETLICSRAYDEIQTTEKLLPFVRKNAYIIISILTILLFVITVALVRIVKNTLGNNWRQLGNVLN